jgi:hypothetical protein
MKNIRNTRDDLESLEAALTEVVGAILQKSNRVAGTIIGVATSKLVAAGITAGTMGAIGAFGAASTGTAIATLSGAAATTATLYWIGSTVGLGVAAGGLMLAGGAFAVGIPSAIWVRKKVLGRPRTEDNLTQQEQALLYATLRLATATRAIRQGGTSPRSEEKHLVAKYSIAPLVDALRSTYLTNSKDPKTCPSQPASLAILPRRRMRSAEGKLEQIRQEWMRH